MTVREIKENELNELLELYIHLHETGVPEDNEKLKDAWETIINDKNHHISRKRVCVSDFIVLIYSVITTE